LKYMLMQSSKLYRFTGCLAAALILLSGLNPSSAAAAIPASPVPALPHYDVVVIGSEIQGVLLAKEAVKAGLKVLMLDPDSGNGNYI
jgi:hypothetical protein